MLSHVYLAEMQNKFKKNQDGARDRHGHLHCEHNEAMSQLYCGII